MINVKENVILGADDMGKRSSISKVPWRGQVIEVEHRDYTKSCKKCVHCELDGYCRFARAMVVINGRNVCSGCDYFEQVERKTQKAVTASNQKLDTGKTKKPILQKGEAGLQKQKPKDVKSQKFLGVMKANDIVWDAAEVISINSRVFLYDIQAKKKVYYVIMPASQTSDSKVFLSPSSDLAKALLGKRKNDVINIRVQGRNYQYTVLFFYKQ